MVREAAEMKDAPKHTHHRRRRLDHLRSELLVPLDLPSHRSSLESYDRPFDADAAVQKKEEEEEGVVD